MQWWVWNSLMSAPLLADAGCETSEQIVSLLVFIVQQYSFMATNLQRFTTSYGSRHFVASCCWMQTASTAGNAARQWVLIGLSHAILYCVKRSMSENKTLLPTKCNFCDSCSRSFSLWWERAKHFVNVHLHCIVNNLKRISQISTL